MKKTVLRILFAIGFAFVLCLSVSAQKQSTGERAMKAVFVIVGKSAKITTQTVKVVAPIALHITGKTVVITAKTAGLLIEKSLPVVKKLLVTYLKAKLPL